MSYTRKALVAELELHGQWFKTEYHPDEVPEGATWAEPYRLVHRVSTVATDEAIRRYDLFTEQEFIALLEYRQAVEAFNQRVDGLAFYVDDPAVRLELIKRVHWRGIGDADSEGAHAAYAALRAALRE